MITVLVRRVLPLCCLALVLGYLACNQPWPPAVGDTYFHLRFGHEFLTHWSVAEPGNLGPYDSADWVPTQWLSQMAMSRVEDRLGLTGVLWVGGTVMLALVASVYIVARSYADALPSALVTGLAYVALAPGLSVRPQLLSYILVLLCAHAWFLTAADLRPRWWLIPTTWIWTMVHGMWPVGIAIAVATILGIAVEGRAPRRRLAHLALIPVLSSVAVVLTPVGVDAYRALLDVGSRSSYFSEWAVPTLVSPTGGAVLAMAACIVVPGLRRGQVPWTSVATVILAFFWTVYSERTVGVAAMILVPQTATALQALVPQSTKPRWREIAGIGAMVICASVVLAIRLPFVAADPVPAWVDAELDARPSGDRVLNEWSTGSYLLWRHPELSIVMHGYGDVFTPAELERNAGIMRLAPGWDQDVDRIAADLALVDPASSLGYALMDDPRWHIVRRDADFALLQETTAGEAP